MSAQPRTVSKGKARLNRQGRVVIPAECRAAAGLKPGFDPQLTLRVVAFDERQARTAARLRCQTRDAGSSFGDRACLALGCPVVAADRVWAEADIDVKIVLVR